MAQRVTCTTNSSGHDGTYVYRSTSTMDPQNLPAPIADEPPVAQGETFEYIDSEELAGGTYYYRTQDHEGGEVSAASDEFVFDLGPDYASAQIGDEIGGGIYAGTMTYADGRQYHIICGNAASEVDGVTWGHSGTVTDADDPDDGKANTDIIVGLGGSQAVDPCVAYNRDGYSDWYLWSDNEAGLCRNNLFDHPEYSELFNSGDYAWTSSEVPNDTDGDTLAKAIRPSFSADPLNKTKTTAYRARPIRRVAV